MSMPLVRLSVALALAILLSGLAAVTVSNAQGPTASTLGGGAGVSWRNDSAIIAKVNPSSDISSGARKWFGIQVKGTGAAATSWTAELQVSLDGSDYRTIVTHSNTTDSDGDILWISTPAPALHFRSEVSAVVLGSATALSVTIIGMN
jgi:hypothetical protein